MMGRSVMAEPNELFAGYMASDPKGYGVNVTRELIAKALGVERLTPEMAETWIEDNYVQIMRVAKSRISALPLHAHEVVIRLEDAWW